MFQIKIVSFKILCEKVYVVKIATMNSFAKKSKFLINCIALEFNAHISRILILKSKCFLKIIYKKLYTVKIATMNSFAEIRKKMHCT